MRAFWLFSPNIGAGTEASPNRPNLDSVGGRWVAPGDMIILEGPVGNEHTHLFLGGITMADESQDGIAGSRHYHYLIYNGTNWVQTTVDNIGSTPDHTHTFSTAPNGFPIPDYYLVFWAGSDSEATSLLALSGNTLIVEAVQNGSEIVGLDNTPWTGPQQTNWYNQVLNFLGLKIPPEVDRGRRLVLMLLGMLDSRAVQDEHAYRRITSAA